MTVERSMIERAKKWVIGRLSIASEWKHATFKFGEALRWIGTLPSFNCWVCEERECFKFLTGERNVAAVAAVHA